MKTLAILILIILALYLLDTRVFNKNAQRIIQQTGRIAEFVR